ncbi:MAG: thioredoxin domain-containing protein [Patescibacteria group bacterium]
MSQSILDNMPPKTTFIVGFIAAILVIGTIGFIVLGSCIMKGGCTGSDEKSGNIVVNNPSPAPSDQIADPEPQPTAEVPKVTSEDHVLGNENAKITFIEYSDFECTYCSSFYPTMQKIIADYEGDVRWVYRHFPLSFHANAGPAAEASECAGDQGKFWEFADKLYNGAELSDSSYKKIAGDLGLNVDEFTNCIDSGIFIDKISSDFQGGASAGISGTPGTFIVGPDGSAEQIKGALPYEMIKPILDELLAQ